MLNKIYSKMYLYCCAIIQFLRYLNNQSIHKHPYVKVKIININVFMLLNPSPINFISGLVKKIKLKIKQVVFYL